MRQIKFRAVMQRRRDLKYFVTDGYTTDTGLSLLFGFENDRLDEFKDMVMNSEKFFKTIGTKWWEEDWCHVDLGQFTGLKDKNGVEIYEGDIVKVRHFLDERKKINAEIKFSDCAFIIDMVDMESYLSNEREDIEVIGNIYEHHHLLDKKEIA